MRVNVFLGDRRAQTSPLQGVFSVTNRTMYKSNGRNFEYENFCR